MQWEFVFSTLGSRFGRKTKVYVLPKIAAALSEFIAPISGARQRLTTHPSAATGHSQQDFQRVQPPRYRSSQKDHEKDHGQDKKNDQKRQEKDNVVPLPQASPPKSTSETGTTEAGVSHNFLQLFNLFRDQRLTLLGWLGQKSYTTSQKTTKKSASIKRGSILDHKAE